MYLKEIWDLVPDNKPQQYSSSGLLYALRDRFVGRRIKVLDLGCGNGKSIDWFMNSGIDCEWKGLDIEDSPEVRARVRTDGEFHTYDGVHVPFADEAFDVVFSHQVFGRLRHPERVLREIVRVLKPEGLFVGSVSYLEPLHSYSIFNFTPYGWYTVSIENGLVPTMLAGGIDSLGLIERSLGREMPTDLWRCSPLNKAIIADSSLSDKAKNYKILMNAGHMVFVSRKASYAQTTNNATDAVKGSVDELGSGSPGQESGDAPDNAAHKYFAISSYAPDFQSVVGTVEFDFSLVELGKQLSTLTEAWVKGGSLEKAIGLLDSETYPFSSYGHLEVSMPINWSLGDPGRHNLSWQLHSLPFLRDLACAFSETGEHRYIDCANSIVNDWLDGNTQAPFPSVFSWNDHSTAFRLNSLAYYFAFLLKSKPLDRSVLELLSLIAERHMRVLLCDNFYERGTNHGLDQAYALYQASRIFSFLICSSEAHSVSLSRLEYELNKSFSSEHVHIENSPEYHCVIMNSTLQINSVVESMEGRSLLGDTKEFVRGALNYLSAIIRPDGLLPPLGDTEVKPSRFKFDWLSGFPGFDQYKHAINCGADGKADSACHKFFPESGYAVLRGALDRFSYADRPHLIFKCGFLSHYHRQDDDNHILVYAYGEEWLTDGGLYKHDHGDPQREHMRSHFAHSVIAPVGARAQRTHCPEPVPRITSCASNGRVANVSGFTSMFEGFEWDRALRYDGVGEFVVSDSIRKTSAASDVEYEQFWQIPADKELEIAGGIITVKSTRRSTMLRIYIASDSLVAIEEMRPQPGSTFCWKSPRYGELEPVKMIRLSFKKGAVADVTTTFTFSECEGAVEKSVSDETEALPNRLNTLSDA
ncbi:heparinase II/III family protein [Burkholderia cepacia]|uniref:Methylase involved in ubiquinone menaquinone biosynthesis-like protein n=1 Tax=Burkholderia cepacia GG4 TaxID=1009846 RepID=A0A9W3JZX8_BURCE|nr:heparinase II/III family protein [Burkholderia cepacia]AFQ48279.1 methylase involved in ubiquinone menaquinone biosynthesis-like protein [Burkholderia cepacia GG4]